MPRKQSKYTTQAQPENDSAFAGLESVLPEDTQQSIMSEATRMLREGLREGDLNKVKIAKEAVMTFKRGLGDKEGEKVLFPVAFVEAVVSMSKSEFAIPSQLEKHKDALRERT